MPVPVVQVVVIRPVVVAVRFVVVAVPVGSVSMVGVVRMIVGGQIVVRLSRGVFVLVGVLELAVAVGMGVHRRHQLRVPARWPEFSALRASVRSVSGHGAVGGWWCSGTYQTSDVPVGCG